ncbi:MAG: DUF1553 domain-containing protein [Planctomycetota bacterium]
MSSSTPTPRRAFVRAARLAPALALAAGATVVALETTRVFAGPAGEGETTKTETKRSVPPAKDVAKKIDSLLAAKWRDAKVKPARRTEDSEFLRRVALDVTGSIPSEDVTRRFLHSDKPGKREALIQELVESKAADRTLALRWAYLLVGREYLIRAKAYKQVMRLRRMAERMRAGGGDGEMGGESMGGTKPREGEKEMSPGYGEDEEILTFNEWLERCFAEKRGFDQITTDLISAKGTTVTNPAVHYMLRFARDGKAPEMTGHVMRVFQGLQIQCAQCHDDKFEPTWSQHTFWGIAAFFARTGARRLPPPGMTMAEAIKNKKQGPYELFDRAVGQIRIPAPPGEEGRLVLPEFFVTGAVINPANAVDRRLELAKLITDKDNPYFAKAIVNRFWSFYMGRGIIDPVDAINQKDYPLPELMNLLTEDFKASGYDSKRLIEIILRTDAYQLSSEGKEDGRDDALTLFARAPLRSLSAEQLFYSVAQATGVEDVGNGDRRARRRLEQIKFQTLQQFVRTFGTDDENDETVDEGTIPQALMRLNGPLTNKAVQARPGHPVYDRLFRMPKLKDRIDTIYLRVLSRYPSAEERKKVTKYLSQPESRAAAGHAQAVADVFWALLNSTEFNLNH